MAIIIAIAIKYNKPFFVFNEFLILISFAFRRFLILLSIYKITIIFKKSNIFNNFYKLCNAKRMHKDLNDLKNHNT